MFRAMAMKELRETRGIFLVALAAYGYLVAIGVNPRLPFGSRLETFVPFVQDNFLGWFLFLSGALTIAVGLRQTLGESIPGTYPFLLHRPAGRRWLIGMKLLVGMGGYLICSAVPILVYGLWAATPGTHASPFEWSMTVFCWIVWLGMTLIYLGAVLTGIRPGRWYRSRLLPLAAAAIVTLVSVAIGVALGKLSYSVLAIIVADAWMLAAIFFVARTRDYS